jgi:diguanylate cyclase (GGDEF)-like protein
MRNTNSSLVTSWTPTAWILPALTLAVVGLIGATGGRSSEFVSLLYLPLLLAVIRYSGRAIFVTGLVLTLIYVLLPSGRSTGSPFDYRDAIKVVIFNTLTLCAALYARIVRSERDRLSEAVEEKDSLLTVSQVVTSFDKLDHALDSALLLLKNVLPGVRSAAIYLLDEGGRHLVRESEIGPVASVERARLEDIPSGWAIRSLEPFVAPAGTQLALSKNDGPRARALAGLSALNVPLGLLYVEFDGPNPPGAGEVRKLGEFAERIGFPIHKIRMQEGLHSLAFTDQMTGLQNYRAFRAQLEDEWKRSARYNRPLSLILIDLDKFKDVNDKYGHPAGDRLLESVGEVLRETVRETDVPARYGGEEFAVVCPETSEEDARIVAERVRAAVEMARFQVAPNEEASITCSLGVATHPSHASNEEALIDAADAALYCAKRSGRNTIRTADSLPFLASETGT